MRSLVAALFLVSTLTAQSLPAAAAPADPTAPTPADSRIEREFIDLHQLLDQMATSFGASRKFCAPDPGSVLAARLALFQRRFGLEPRTAPPWAALRDRAEVVLKDAGDRGHPESGAIQDVSGQMDRYALLDLLGRTEEARAILASVSTAGADNCPWCTAENSVVVNQRRSEEAERRGDVEAALRFLHDAALDMGVISDPAVGGLPGEDLLLFRYGVLLQRTGHEDVGRIVLQDLVRTRPDSLGGRLAREDLAIRHELDGVEQARFLSGWFGVVAVLRLDQPASVHWIAARLPPRSENESTHTVAFDTAAFEEARRPLEARLASGIESLTVLDGLPGGAEPFVDTWLSDASRIKERRSAP